MLITIVSNDESIKLHHEFKFDNTLSLELFINMFVPYLAAKLQDSTKAYHFEINHPNAKQIIKFFYSTLQNNSNLVKAAVSKCLTYETVKKRVVKSKARVATLERSV